MSSFFQRGRAGLTLIEVMLAMVIVGTGIAAMVAATARCLGVVRRAKNFEAARHLLAMVDVENPIPLKEEITEDAEGGAFSGDYLGFKWERRIEAVGDPEISEGLYKVTTRVSWSDAARSSHEEVTTYIYAPEPTYGGTVQSR